MRWRALALAVPLALSSGAGFAWNAAGHRLSAEIAWQRLDRTTREQVAELLRPHPDYARWVARGKDADPARTAFVEASTWPDDIRRDKRFYHAGIEQPTPTLAGFPDMERRRHWHYVDRPLARGAPARPSAGELDRRLTSLAATVGDRRAELSARSYALPWLIHLVGDAHQPLHAASRYDDDGRGDQGGNALTVDHPLHPRRTVMSLHAYWDDLPGAPWLRGSRLEAAARALSELHAPPPAATPEGWLDESWRIAHDDAYPPGDDAIPTINREFHDNAQEIARRRVAEAGYRLAELLHGILRKMEDTR